MKCVTNIWYSFDLHSLELSKHKSMNYLFFLGFSGIGPVHVRQ